jgi:hypothetical protein
LTGSELHISASDYLLYRKCPRSLHLRLTGQRTPASSSAEERYPVASDRSMVQALGRERFPDAVEASSADSDGAGDAATILNATCTFAPFVATADARIAGKGGGVLVLFREGASVKESYLREAAFLDHCFQGCGAAPERLVVHHVNKSYQRIGALDPDGFFTEADVTRRARKLAPETSAELEQLRNELRDDPSLAQYRDTLCARPIGCPACSRALPERRNDHVSTLHRGGALVQELLAEGITLITDIPSDRLVHRRQEIQQQTLLRRRPHVDTTALQRFLERLAPPVCYLDFEAICTAVPPFDGVRPWEHVPYLYSVHRETASGDVTHAHWIMEPGLDGRTELLRHLIADLAGEGSIVVYSAGFERGVLSRFADLVPEAAAPIDAMLDRIVDLLVLFSDFAVYHHGQGGKVSLKRVLPALTRRDYSDLTIQDGYAANLAFRYLSECVVPAGIRASVVADLVRYCALDTMAMVHIVRELRELAAS